MAGKPFGREFRAERRPLGNPVDSFTLDKLEFDRIRHILARYCRCELGRGLALRIGPSRRPETVRRWLEETTQMVRAIREDGPPPFGGITDIAPAMARAAPGGGASGEDFAAIASTLEGAGAVLAWGQRLTDSVPLVKEMAGGLPGFADTVRDIRSVIDSRGQVMDSASETLSRIRRDIGATRHRIHEVIYGYVRRPEVTKILQNPIVTLHDDRFVLPVKAEHRHQLPGVVHRASQTGATLFVEPSESVEMNNELVELTEQERREVARLLAELAIRVHRRHEHIEQALRALSRVDLLAAKAQYAAEFDFHPPEITEQGSLQLHQARHPLLVEQAYQQEGSGGPRSSAGDPKRPDVRRDLGTPAPPAATLKGGPQSRGIGIGDPVVPIDVRLGVDFDVLIITGSNTGGKTVALKTVGLAAVMAQSGLHVPAAAGSTMPVFRDVLLDVGDEQSLQQSLSTFGAHVRRLNHILRCANRFSLVLLDELGAGTDPDEGAAIGQAVLDHLKALGCLTMVTTHLSVLKAYGMHHERVDNASVDFDTRTLRPTYHLRIGEPGESHAIAVAAAMGLPQRLIESARRYFFSKGAAFRKAIAATKESRRASETARSEAHTARMAAQSAESEYAAKLTQLQRLQGDFEAWLASLAELKSGDEVRVPSMNKTGRLVRVQFNKQIAVVDVDNLQVEVPLAELMPDLGQSGVRQEIADLRQQILAQARQQEQMHQDAQRLHQQYQRSLSQQQARRQQYEQWLAAIASAEVGRQVPISRPPGTGTLLELDLMHSQAKVETPEGVLELPVQDLFPQTGPFARRQPQPAGQGGDPKRDPSRLGATHARPGPVEPNRPLPHRSPNSAAAKSVREAVLSIQPGQQVYVIPFHKRATLIRFNEQKDQAIVQSGAFEVQLPLSDLELPR